MGNVIVIGGGPAGMMAAVAASEEGNRVTLIEKNEKLGKKLFITGKGRCNITNSCEQQEFFGNVMTNPKFLYSAFYRFDNTGVMDFFEESGCPVKVERGGRVFPVTDHSSDVIAALERRLKRNGVSVFLNSRAESLLTQADQEGLRVSGIRVMGGKCFKADSVILATGGLSYPLTGSTGDGYEMAGELGHGLADIRPSLIPFEIKEEWCKKLQGLSLKNVSVTMHCQGKQIFKDFGEMIFTHFGVSGPLILSASSHYGKAAYSSRDKKGIENVPVQLSIDLKPALTQEQLDKRILRDFMQYHRKQFSNGLDGLLPAKLIPVMVDLSGIDPCKKISDITKEERKKLLGLLKNLTLTITGTREMKEAIITRGGIPVKEVKASTMESKKVRGLHFAGEILDVDALTGGYNLQIAWSTGFLAGKSV